MIKTELITKSLEETQKIGKEFAQKINGGGLLCLYGELGAGKTSFTQGLAEGLGIKRRVNSPTFIIMRSYVIGLQNQAKHLYHLDLYRINSDRDIEGLGVAEILEDPTNIIVIEWPEKAEKILPNNRTNIYFKYLGDDERSITIHEN
ncbi:tRNA (adenosine(37)-N6)-threonylcarbamoyltransferase complex ATPase subunit type 1 TsaE [soil metagenome]